jgi:hypothetical protein
LLKWVGSAARVASTSRGGTAAPVGSLSRAGMPARARPVLFGVAVVLAYAPFISLTGDYYEAGSIALSRVAYLVDSSVPLARWRSDDLPKLVSSLHRSGGGTAGDWIGITGSFIAGVALAWLTYRIGGLVYSVIHRSVVAPPTTSGSSSGHGNS